MLLTNQQIYAYTENLFKSFSDKNQILPLKLNFIIQKNMNTLLVLAQEVDNIKNDFIKDCDINLDLPKEIVQQFQELLMIEQEVNILTFKLEQYQDLSLTFEQTNAIMFMIEE